MTGRFRRLILLGCCLVVAAFSTVGAASGPARGAVLRAHGTTTHPRCAVRNRATGTVRVALGRGQSLFNTLTLNEYQGGGVAGLLESYFVVDNRLRMIPVMATQVPTLKNGGIRDGGKTVILHLKAGLRWSNGAEITSADATFGWRIDRDQATGPACSGPCGEIRAIETPGRYTLIFRLRHVTPSLLLGGLPSIWPTRWPGAWNGDAHVAAIKLTRDPSFDFKGPNFPTDGPYQVSRVVEGKRVILQPMKYYSTMTCGGSIGTIVDEVLGSDASLLADVVAGRLDLWSPLGNAVALLPEIERHSGYAVHVDPAFNIENMEFNVDSTVNGVTNPLHDARVRLALALAIDKRQLIRTVLPVSARQARGILAWTPWINQPGLVQPFADRTIRGQWDPIAKAYLSDTGQGRALADARKLLAGTRWKSGFTLDVHTLDTPRRTAALPVLTAAWARLGVTVHTTVHAARTGGALFASWNDGGLLAHGAFQVAVFAYIGTSSPDGFAFNLASQYIDRRHKDHSLIAANDSGIDNPVIDRAFATAGSTVDRKVRARNFAVLQREINRNAYWVPLYFFPDIWTSSGRIRNVSYSAGFSGVEWNIWAWKLRGR